MKLTIEKKIYTVKYASLNSEKTKDLENVNIGEIHVIKTTTGLIGWLQERTYFLLNFQKFIIRNIGREIQH